MSCSSLSTSSWVHSLLILSPKNHTNLSDTTWIQTCPTPSSLILTIQQYLTTMFPSFCFYPPTLGPASKLFFPKHNQNFERTLLKQKKKKKRNKDEERKANKGKRKRKERKRTRWIILSVQPKSPTSEKRFLATLSHLSTCAGQGRLLLKAVLRTLRSELLKRARD